MPHFDNDIHHFGHAVDQAVSYLDYFIEGSTSLALKLESSRPLAGPYRTKASSGFLRNTYTRVLNALLWKQHALNLQLLKTMNDNLLAQQELSQFDPSRPLLAVIVPDDVSENFNGGSSRIWGLCESLAQYYRIHLLTITGRGKNPERRKIFPGVDLLSFPVPEQIELEIQQRKETFGRAAQLLTLGDTDLPFPAFDEYLRRTGESYSCLIMIAPYLFERIRSVCPTMPIVYENHDVNRSFLGRIAGEHKDRALPALQELEEKAFSDAAFSTCVSSQDMAEISQLFPQTKGRIHLIPNGVSTKRAFRTSPKESFHLGQSFGFSRPAVLFVGSVLAANIQAMTFIIQKLAPAFPNTQWVIVGVTFAEYTEQAGPCTLPANLLFTGKISESEKEAVTALCQLGVAPMGDGTGSSLKISDYIAHGKPVITTEVGLRGFDHLTPHVDIASLNDFEPVIKDRLSQLKQDPASLDAQAESAWKCVKETLDWPVIAKQLHQHIESAIPS